MAVNRSLHNGMMSKDVFLLIDSLVLAWLVREVSAWTRYNPIEDTYLCQNLQSAGDKVTPFGSLLIQDFYHGVLSKTHAYISIPIVGFIALQWVRTKGDATHVKLGTALKCFLIFMLVQGMVLHVRHSFFSKPKYPPFFMLPMIRPLVTTFGFSLTNSVFNAFFVGIRDPFRRVTLQGPCFWCLVVINATAVATAVWLYVYMVIQLLSNPILGNFTWEINLEMFCVFSVVPIYDLSNAWALAGWLQTGELQSWKEHHVMNAIWITSEIMAVVLMFVAHDARRVFAYPGVNSIWVRLAMQLVPQFALLLPYALRIRRYIIAAGPNQGQEKGASTHVDNTRDECAASASIAMTVRLLQGDVEIQISEEQI